MYSWKVFERSFEWNGVNSEMQTTLWPGRKKYYQRIVKWNGPHGLKYIARDFGTMLILFIMLDLDFLVTLWLLL